MNVSVSLLTWPASASRHADLLLSLLFSAGIGAELARIVLALIAVAPAPHLPALPAAPVRVSQVDVASIVAAHLFGSPATALDSADHAPASRSTLKLVGTLAGRDPATGLALISDQAKSFVLRIGESATGVSLRYVYADHVILDRGGIPETLTLARPVDPARAPVAKTPRTSPRRSP
jgi:type II secretory pathway component PulC